MRDDGALFSMSRQPFEVLVLCHHLVVEIGVLLLVLLRSHFGQPVVHRRRKWLTALAVVAAVSSAMVAGAEHGVLALVTAHVVDAPRLPWWLFMLILLEAMLLELLHLVSDLLRYRTLVRERIWLVRRFRAVEIVLETI